MGQTVSTLTYRGGMLRRLAASVAAALVAVSVAALPARADDPLSVYYDQELTWEKCSGGLECSWLTVPLDYADPSGSTIRIRVSRKAATGPERRGSLVVNPGGPGMGGVSLPSYLSNVLSPRVKQAYDIVGFDPRGTGESSPISCLTGPETTRLYAFDATPDTAAERATLMDLAAGIARGCLKRSPEIARHVGTEDTVRDLDILREALADDKLNWLGYSYGTAMGAMYAERFPDRVGRFVLDGAVDLSFDALQTSHVQNDGFQRAITRFARDCVHRANCPYSGDYRHVLRGMSSLLDHLESQSLDGYYGPVGESEAITAIFYSMYSPDRWRFLRRALVQAERGNGEGLSWLSDSSTQRTGKNSYAGNMASAFPAISCWDSGGRPTFSQLRAAATAWQRTSAIPQVAQALAWSNAACTHWYGQAERGPGPVSSTTPAPILIIGTTYDPATPYSEARSLARQLPTSRLLTYVGDGHTAFLTGSTCIDNAVTTYLVDGILPSTGTHCR